MQAITRRSDADSFTITPEKYVPSYAPRPYLSKEDKRRLKAINHNLEWHWNGAFPHWEIWFDNHMDEPYCIYRVIDMMGKYRPIDQRTYDDVREAFWESQKSFRERAYKYYAERQRELERREAADMDKHYQLGKEVAPMIRTLADAGTASHGNSVTQWSGAEFGSGEQS